MAVQAVLGVSKEFYGSSRGLRRSPRILGAFWRFHGTSRVSMGSQGTFQKDSGAFLGVSDGFTRFQVAPGVLEAIQGITQVQPRNPRNSSEALRIPLDTLLEGLVSLKS